ncbi:MAG: DUF3810 domain-containing protein [Bacteroidota bacterium]
MNWRKFLFNHKTFWIGLGIISIVFSVLLPAQFVEEYYSRGLFIYLRKIMSFLTGWLPFAFVYVLFLILMFFVGKWILDAKKSKKRIGQKIIGFMGSLLAFLGGAIFFFQFLWGFNYGRIPLEEQLGLEVKPLGVNELRVETLQAIDSMKLYRNLLEGTGDDPLRETHLPSHVEAEMRDLLKAVLKDGFGIPIPAEVRGRKLFPKGLLLRISTAGVYIPFTGEGHVDAGLHHLQLPFVMAHEMSHAYGIGGEGDCNFLAYLACLQSTDPYLRYVGHLYFFRYVAPDFRAYRPEEYKEIWSGIPEAIKNDLRAIRKQMDKYPDILPAVRDAAYNTYLKAQGIDDGIKNYDRVTMLVHAWRHSKQGKHQEPR